MEKIESEEELKDAIFIEEEEEEDHNADLLHENIINQSRLLDKKKKNFEILWINLVILL